MLQRKDVRYLQPDELQLYRGAVAELQRTGVYDQLSQFHNSQCSMVHGTNLFLPWHRALLVKYETALQSAAGGPVAIPYWNCLDQDVRGPLPDAFSAEQAEIGGQDVRNPLFPVSVQRFDEPSHLRHLPNPSDWSASPTWAEFGGKSDGSGSLEDSHDKGHHWVGLTMYDIASAATDPVFWSYHAFIDYIWALQQGQPGRDPVGGETALPLPGMPGQTVRSVLHISDLGYEYLVATRRARPRIDRNAYSARLEFADLIQGSFRAVRLRYRLKPSSGLTEIRMFWGGARDAEERGILISLFGGAHAHGHAHMPRSRIQLLEAGDFSRTASRDGSVYEISMFGVAELEKSRVTPEVEEAELAFLP